MSEPSFEKDHRTGADAIGSETVVGLPQSLSEGPQPGVEPERGASIGRYVVLSKLGAGAMGVVLAAYDPELDRKVAVKLLKTDRQDESAARTRLQREAQALARLSHVNVVAVHDVGVHEGQVFVAMEYVDGQTLQAWMTSGTGGTPRPWREVVRVFAAAGRGLMAAHEHGLVHRDFKPDNVMVGAGAGPDGADRVRVTDFGLARATATMESGASAERSDIESRPGAHGGLGTSLTRTGALLGTPAYMAPEQFSGQQATASSDQYAYAVALYEALYGEHPFGADTVASLAAVVLAGKVRNAPEQASVPMWLRRVVLQGLAVRPDERWPSMEALLQALAWDPARRRNRWLLGLGTVGVLSLAGVTWQSLATVRAARCTGAEDQLAGIWDDARRAQVKAAVLGVEKSYATAVWERTRQEIDAYARDWTAMHTETCEATSVRGEQSSAIMDLRMACLHRAAVELEAATAQLADADAEVVQKAHKVTGGLRPLGRCGDIEALQEEVEPPLPEDAGAVDRIRMQLAQAEAARHAGRYAQARQRVEAAKPLLTEVAYGPLDTEAALVEARILRGLGEYEAAETVLRRALKRASQQRQWAEMAEAASLLLHVVGYQQQRLEEGLWYSELAAGLATGEPLLEAIWRNSLGDVLSVQGKYEEAEAEYRRALAMREKALGPDHPDVASLRTNLGNVLQNLEKYEEAQAECRRALELLEKALGPDHPRVATSRNNLGNALQLQNRDEEAEAEHRRALAIFEKALGPNHSRVAVSRNNLGNVLTSQGKYEEAEAELRRALVISEKARGPDHLQVATSRNNLGSILEHQGKYEEADAEYQVALAIREKALGPDHADVAMSQFNLAGVALKLGRAKEAVALAEASWRRVQQDDMPPGHRGGVAFFLARALWAAGGSDDHRTRSRKLAEGALATYTEAGDAEASDRVRAWLKEHPVR